MEIARAFPAFEPEIRAMLQKDSAARAVIVQNRSLDARPDSFKLSPQCQSRFNSSPLGSASTGRAGGKHVLSVTFPLEIGFDLGTGTGSAFEVVAVDARQT